MLGGSTCSQVLRGDVQRSCAPPTHLCCSLLGLFALFLASLDSVRQNPAQFLTIPLACISETVRQRLVSAEKLPVR